MNKVAEDVKLDPITEGIVSQGVASYYVAPKTSISEAYNFNNDTLGVMSFRKSLIGSFVPENTTVWASQLFQPSGGSSRIYYQVGQALNYQTALAPSGSTTYTGVFPTSYTARFSIIQGNLLMTAGSTAAIRYTTGASAPATIAGISGAPSDIDIINAGFGGRIWYASSTNANNRLYYTDVIPAAGVASTTGTSQYLTINAGNGDYITGLVQGQQVLFVFTNNGVYRVYNTQSQDNAPVSNVGVLKQEHIVRATDGIYFYHPTGFYKLSEGGQSQLISSRISSNIPTETNTGDLLTCVAWSNDNYVYFSFEKSFINAGGNAAGSLVYRYTISTQVWTMYKFLRNLIKTATVASDRTGLSIVYLMGTTSESNARFASQFAETLGDGTLNSSSSIDDNSIVPIIGSYITQWEDFGTEGHSKRINGMTVPNLNANGFDITYQVDNDNVNEWRNVGRLGSTSSTLFKDFVSVPFNKIRFKVMGQKKSNGVGGSYCWIGSPTIIKLTDMGYE